MLPTISLLPQYAKRFLAGYPWIYANEIEQSHATKNLPMGTLVQVQYQGTILATGYFNRHSLISFRTLTRTPAENIEVTFFIKRLEKALAIRQLFFPLPYYRLVHAEADELPGLIIDRFQDIFVIQINTQGMDQLKMLLIEALQTLFNPSTLYLIQDASIRTLEGLPLEKPEIIGNPFSHLTVIENHTQFTIKMDVSQKTGWFFDHRENRSLIAALAKNKTLIDYFCYSGGFCLQAAKGEAKRVIGVDSSKAALENAQQSAILNQVENSCEWVCEDVFKDLEQRSQLKEKFDIVVLDPPAFVKTKKDLLPGLKGYEKLLCKALPLVASPGILLIASCSYHVSSADLKNCLARALTKTQRAGRILKMLSAGFDHPEHPLLPESSYLKGFLVALN